LLSDDDEDDEIRIVRDTGPRGRRRGAALEGDVQGK